MSEKYLSWERRANASLKSSLGYLFFTHLLQSHKTMSLLGLLKAKLSCWVGSLKMPWQSSVSRGHWIQHFKGFWDSCWGGGGQTWSLQTWSLQSLAWRCQVWGWMLTFYLLMLNPVFARGWSSTPEDTTLCSDLFASLQPGKTNLVGEESTGVSLEQFIFKSTSLSLMSITHNICGQLIFS